MCKDRTLLRKSESGAEFESATSPKGKQYAAQGHPTISEPHAVDGLQKSQVGALRGGEGGGAPS
ncbi:hypothetical protein ACFL59_12315, partial [Planctomycetota bacterium]